MVMVAGPVVAVPLAVSVNALALVALLGLNDAVTPAGKPEADKLTLPLKPFCGVTVMVVDPVAPWTSVKLFGDAERAKLPWGFTVREIVVVLVRLPEVPVIVTVTVPTVAVPVAERVRRLLVVVGFVPKVAATPLGKAETAKFTLPLNPLNGFSGSVNLAVSALPNGVAATFGTNPTTTSSLLTLSATGTATVGTVTVTITGTSGSLTSTTTISLTVNPQGSFALSASPNSLTLVQGATGSTTITVTPQNGFNGSVSLSASGLPAGVTASFNPSSATSASAL